MADRHGQTQPIGQFVLKLLFEEATTGGVRATAIGLKQQVSGTGKVLG